MSCGGNRFECALKRKSRLTTQSDRPSNLELYNENQKRLNDLMRAREEIDNQFFRPINSQELTASQELIATRKLDPQSVNCLLQESIIVDDIEMNQTSVTYTPWVVPSATKSNFTN
jgi:hypothetical protein